MLRMADVDPDLVIADVFLPGRNRIRAVPLRQERPHRHVRVVLTAGLLEPFDEDEARRAGCDAILKKPFEASVVMETIRPLVQEAQLARGLFAEAMASARRRRAPAGRLPVPPRPPPLDPERVGSRHHAGARRRAARPDP